MSELVIFINSVPPVVWGTIIGSSLTIVGVYLTNSSNNERLRIQLQHEKDKRREDIRRERAEELYVESKKYLDFLGSYYLPYISVMKEEITFNQALDITNDSQYEHDFRRIEMIIDMYFPEFKEPFKSILKMRDTLNTIVSGYKKQYKTGNTDGRQWLPLFQDSLSDYCNKTANFEKLIASIEINL